MVHLPGDDPRAPVVRAAGALHLVGLSMAGGGGLVLVCLAFVAPSVGRVLRAAVWLLYVIPGVLYVLFGTQLGGQKRWAVLGALGLALLHFLILLSLSVPAALIMFGAVNDPPQSMCAAMMILPLSMLVLGLLIRQLTQSFEALKYPPIMKSRGFEPVMSHPDDVLPDRDDATDGS